MAGKRGLTEEISNRRVVIVNKFGACHPSITGRSSRKLADYLSENGIEVIVVSIHAPYKGQVSDKEEQLAYRTIELPCLYKGDNKVLRLLGNLIDGFRLLTRSMLLPRHQLKIVMTDPSLINAWAVLFRPFYRSRLVFWTMDLYPEAFASAGFVSSGNPVYRLLASFVYHKPPDYLIALGEQQYRYLCRQYHCETIPHIILPCGVYESQPVEAPFWRKECTDKIIFCYAGNVGEAHDASFLVEMIRRLDPEKHVMVLSIYGAKADWVWERIGGIQTVIRVDYVSPNELQHVDVNVASLLSTWNHVCVPSKVVSAICAGTPVLYNANEESEGACMFPDAIWLVPESDNLAVIVMQFLNQLSPDTIHLKREAAQKFARELIKMERKNMLKLLKIIK